VSFLDQLRKKGADAPGEPPARQRCRFVEHKGREILVTDFTGVAGVWYVRAVREALAFVKESGRRDLRMLYDVTDTKVFDGALPTLKQAATDSKHLVRKRAVIGISEVQMAFLRAVAAHTGEDIRAFRTREEAMDWLAEG